MLRHSFLFIYLFIFPRIFLYWEPLLSGEKKKKKIANPLEVHFFFLKLKSTEMRQ